MKITKEQMDKIRQINEHIKDLDPILKERLVDYELFELFRDDYLKIRPFISKEKTMEEVESKVVELPESLFAERIKSAATIKEFFDEMKPRTTTETVTVFGFYLEHYQGKQEFTKVDIKNAYFEARVRKPKVIGQGLRDAKNVKGYLVEGSKKGTFRLSNIGENLVLHDLPRRTK